MGDDFCSATCSSDSHCQNAFGTVEAFCGVDSVCYRNCDLGGDACPTTLGLS